MFNLKNIRKVVVIAGALVFASFLTFSAFAAGGDVNISAGLDADGNTPSENASPRANRDTPVAAPIPMSVDNKLVNIKTEPLQNLNNPTKAEKAGASKDVWAMERQEYEQANKNYVNKLAQVNKEIAIAKQKCTTTGECNDLDEAQKKSARLQQDEKAKVDQLHAKAQQTEKIADKQQTEANKELNKAERQNTSDLKSNQRAIDKAQNQIDKSCSGTSDKDVKKCTEAKTSYELAIKEKAKLQGDKDNLAGQRNATKQSDIDGENKAAAKQAADDKKSKFSATAEEAAEAKAIYNMKKNEVVAAQNELNAEKARCAQNGDGVCADLEELEKAVTEAKEAADKSYKEMTAKNKNPAPSEYNSAKASLKDANARVEALDAQRESLQTQLDTANKACAQASAGTSKASKKQAEQFCGQAAALEQKLAALETEYGKAIADVSEAEMGVEGLGSNPFVEDHTGEEYRAFGGDFTGQYDGETGSDVFKLITRRAFIFLVEIKPLVYTFAGFGLIAFAWMAIFNKLSWKWFSNIAIGLFLVANMGRFIEYFVFKDTGGYVAEKSLVYGDYLSKGMADSTYMWVEESAGYVPPEDGSVDGEIPTPEATPEYKDKARGFCGGTSGATGWGNFTSCVKDIVSTGQKAVKAAQTAKDTVDNVKAGIEQVKNAAENIGEAAKSMKGGGVSGFVKAVGQMGSNVNSMVGISGGMVGGVMSNASSISNNLQDVGKSTDQVSELNAKRAQGQGTNAFDRFLKGQKTDADGNVEQLIKTDKNGNAIMDKDGNLVKGDNASDRNFATGLDDITKKVVDKSKDANHMFKQATDTAYAGAKLAEDVTGATDRRNQKNQERAEAKRAEADKKRQDADTIKNFQQSQANKPDPQTTSAKNAVETAKQASNVSKEADAQSKRKETAAKQADENHKAKEDSALKAESAADLAEQKALASGSEQDKKIAERARKTADLARSQANTSKVQNEYAQAEAAEAKAKAEEAAKPVKELADKAREEAIKEAERVAKESAEEAKNVDLTKPQADVDAKAAAAEQAQKAAEAALEKALADKNNAEAIRVANEAKVAADKAARELKSAQQKLVDEQQRKKDAELKASKADTFIKKVEAEKVGIYDGKRPLTQEEQDEQDAEELRKQYESDSNPNRQAQLTENKAKNAEQASRSAEAEAKSKASQAQILAEQAQAAAAKAQQTKNEVDIRAAEQARKRSELAQSEAGNAQNKVVETKAPAVKTAKAANLAAQNEAQYNQEKAQESLKQSEENVKIYTTMAKNLSEQARDAQKEANEKAQAAAASNSAADILAAKEAAQKSMEIQQNAQKAQKDLDKELRSRNEAEMKYYAERTRQAELKKQAEQDAADFKKYMESLSPTEQRRLQELMTNG